MDKLAVDRQNKKKKKTKRGKTYKKAALDWQNQIFFKPTSA